MSKLKLYYSKYSSNCRAVLMLANEIGVDMELKYINLYREENLTPDFLKISPTGQIPVLVDGDVSVYDSHAIAIYLAQKFGTDDSLYPRDFVKRTVVNERLFFEASYLFARLFEICNPICDGSETSISPEKIKRVLRGYESLERFLINGNSYMAGEKLTLADYSIFSTILVLNFLIPIEAEKWPRLADYLKRFESNPNYELNMEGARKQVDLIDKCMEKAKNYHINSFELIYPKPI